MHFMRQLFSHKPAVATVDTDYIKRFVAQGRIGNRFVLSTAYYNTLPRFVPTVANLECLFAELARHKDLHKLNLGGFSHCKITQLPDSISNLSYVTELSLHGNQLRDLPDSMRSLAKLTYLNLGENKLSAIPDAVLQMYQLRTLCMHENNIKRIHEDIGVLIDLQELNLNDNPLSKKGLRTLRAELSNCDVYYDDRYIKRRHHSHFKL